MESGVNDVPGRMGEKAVLIEVGDYTACGIAKGGIIVNVELGNDDNLNTDDNDHPRLICWGKCSNGLCDIPTITDLL